MSEKSYRQKRQHQQLLDLDQQLLQKQKGKKKASVTFSDKPVIGGENNLPIRKSSSAKQFTIIENIDNNSLSDDDFHQRGHMGGITFNTLSIMSATPRSISPLTNTSYHKHNNSPIDGGGCSSSSRIGSGNNTITQSLIRRNDSNTSIAIPTTGLAADELQISRRPSILLQEILSNRRPSAVMASLRTTHNFSKQAKIMGCLNEDPDFHERSPSLNTLAASTSGPSCDLAVQSRKKNRRIGDDALSTALSALYCKLLVILGVALPVTEIISNKIPTNVYQGFYVYLYLGSISFVLFVYFVHLKSRTLFNLLKTYHEKTNNVTLKRRAHHFGSFYLRVGAIAFGIGTMVYSGLEFGQYFELNGRAGCQNIFIALTPAARMALSIFQMQFIFLNTTELDIARHKVIARFGLMHMVATNLCEWLYVLVEETKHEIFHFGHHAAHHKLGEDSMNEAASISGSEFIQNFTDIVKNLTNEAERMFNSTDAIPAEGTQSAHADGLTCQRTNIMGSLVQDASPFLFPCTIEYSLICAVILFEMWKKVKSIPDIVKTRKSSQKANQRSAHHFSVDCSRAHRGLFAGILIIVMTIISLIMYFVLHDKAGYEDLAVQEVTICEIMMYAITSIAVFCAMVRMRDLKFVSKTNDKHSGSISLDCTLLVLAQTGVYVYGMFSIMGSYFSIAEGQLGGQQGLVAEVLGLFQTSIQTLFILNCVWRRCKGALQHKTKPGRQSITFLLVANVCMWFLNTLIKGRAAFRKTHMDFYGMWAWTIITHVSMPLAIFYRFHSTICLFEIWKSAYKAKEK